LIAFEYELEFALMSTDDLTTLLAKLGSRLEEQEQRIKELTSENEKLKQLLQKQVEKKGSKAPKFTENYSVEKNKGKGKSKRGKQATGRRPHSSKIDLVARTIEVYESGVSKASCVERGSQYVWRIIDGRAVYICYRFFSHRETKALPSLPGVRNRLSEYGLEVILIVAFLHYWVGISLDHTCGVVQFFTGLALSKSQANSLLNQLRDDWADTYDTIAGIRLRRKKACVQGIRRLCFL